RDGQGIVDSRRGCLAIFQTKPLFAATGIRQTAGLTPSSVCLTSESETLVVCRVCTCGENPAFFSCRLVPLARPPEPLFGRARALRALIFSSRVFLGTPNSSRSVWAPAWTASWFRLSECADEARETFFPPAKISWRPCSSYHLVSVAVMCIFSIIFRHPTP